MDFTMSDRQKEWLNRVQSFMTKHVRPAVPIYKQQDAEGARWKVIPILEDLKKKKLMTSAPPSPPSSLKAFPYPLPYPASQV